MIRGLVKFSSVAFFVYYNEKERKLASYLGKHNKRKISLIYKFLVIDRNIFYSYKHCYNIVYTESIMFSHTVASKFTIKHMKNAPNKTEIETPNFSKNAAKT